MNVFRKIALAALAGASLSQAAAAADVELAHTLTGRVTKVLDGDTLLLLDDHRHSHRVRLLGVDAPELSQPYGRSSRKYLASLVARQRVAVEWRNRDASGEILGKVLRDHVDVNYQLVWNGLAWHYTFHADEQPEADRTQYAAAETSARGDHDGLWKDASPVPPWEFRKRASRRR